MVQLPLFDELFLIQTAQQGDVKHIQELVHSIEQVGYAD